MSLIPYSLCLFWKVSFEKYTRLTLSGLGSSLNFWQIGWPSKVFSSLSLFSWDTTHGCAVHFLCLCQKCAAHSQVPPFVPPDGCAVHFQCLQDSSGAWCAFSDHSADSVMEREETILQLLDTVAREQLDWFGRQHELVERLRTVRCVRDYGSLMKWIP